MAAAVAGLVSLFFVLPTWWPLWTIVIGGLAFTTVREYRRAEAALLDVARARVVEESQAPHIHRQVERLAAMFDIPVPRIAIAGAQIPSGFVVGTRRRRAVWGSLLTRTISRYREYEADAAAALVVGRADSLMSAIEKLAEEAERIPDRDLRQLDALNPFLMVARRRRSFELFSDHPPVEKRLARLATIAREMGRSD